MVSFYHKRPILSLIKPERTENRILAPVRSCFTEESETQKSEVFSRRSSFLFIYLKFKYTRNKLPSSRF